jgi:hypothetical protein
MQLLSLVFTLWVLTIGGIKHEVEHGTTIAETPMQAF